MEEIWKEIDWCTGYAVSSLGNVKALKRVITRRDGDKRKYKERILKIHLDQKGYPVCYIYPERCFKKTMKVHRLVAEAFIPNPENKPQVNHINGVKDDNRIKNLEWCTNGENGKHAYDNGLKRKVLGEESVNAKLTNDSVKNIRLLKKHGVSRVLIAEYYGVSVYTISDVCSKRTWKHI